MDWTVIEQKLEFLRRCLQRIKEKCPKDVDTLSKDPDAQDILTLKPDSRCSALRGYRRILGHSDPLFSPSRHDGATI